MHTTLRRLGCLGVLALPLLACSNPLAVSNVIQSQILAASESNTLNTLLIRVLNQTGNNLTLDILVDGVPQTIACTASEGVCDAKIAPCPGEVDAVQEQETDTTGHFVSGRSFVGVSGFSFTSGQFQCTSVIVFKFTDRAATAFVI